MNDNVDEYEDIKMALLFRDRGWSEIEMPLEIRDDDDDWSETLRRNGWFHSDLLGHVDGICIDLYTRALDERPSQSRYRWLVEYTATSISKTIVIERWQDLIDFLAHVSSTMLVALLPGDTAHVLEDLFDQTASRVEQRKYQEDRERELQKQTAAAATGEREEKP